MSRHHDIGSRYEEPDTTDNDTAKCCKCSDHFDVEMMVTKDCIEFVCAECQAEKRGQQPERAERELNEALYTASEMAREAVLLRQALEERKQELNEVKDALKRNILDSFPVTDQRVKWEWLVQERDQLIRVVDEFARQSPGDDKWLMADYRDLPHVRAKGKTK